MEELRIREGGRKEVRIRKYSTDMLVLINGALSAGEWQIIRRPNGSFITVILGLLVWHIQSGSQSCYHLTLIAPTWCRRFSSKGKKRVEEDAKDMKEHSWDVDIWQRPCSAITEIDLSWDLLYVYSDNLTGKCLQAGVIIHQTITTWLKLIWGRENRQSDKRLCVLQLNGR